MSLLRSSLLKKTHFPWKMIKEINVDVELTGHWRRCVCVCVFAQRLMCVLSAFVYIFHLCVHKCCTAARSGEISRVSASVLGTRVWVTAPCRSLRPGYEWVWPPARSCQSHGAKAFTRRTDRRESSYRWGGHLWMDNEKGLSPLRNIYYSSGLAFWKWLAFFVI